MNKFGTAHVALCALVVGGFALLVRFADVPGGGELLDALPQELTELTAAPEEADEPTGHSVERYREMLRELDVKGRAPMTEYDRELFGQAWSDDVTVEFGRNGCDTRNDILRRDLVDPVIRKGTYGCLVESGTLEGPYTGKVIQFARGDGQVEIDHVVALADAWAKGAQHLDEEARRNFANDPRNLRAVDTGANRQKGAGDAATWQPSNKAFRCDYARAQIEVKHAYGLWVTGAEYEALARELSRC